MCLPHPVSAETARDTNEVRALIKAARLIVKEDSAQAFQKTKMALAISEEIGSKAFQALAHESLGILHQSLQSYQNSIVHYEEAIYLYDAIGDNAGYLHAQRVLGRVHYALGDYSKALQTYLVALNRYEEIKIEDENLGWLLRYTGSVFKRQEDYDKAKEYYQKALNIFEQANALDGVASALNNLGIIAGLLGDTEEQLRFYQQALDISVERGTLGRATILENNIASWYMAKNNFTEALQHALQGRAYAEEFKDASNLSSTMLLLGTIYVKLGQTEKAAYVLDDAEKFAYSSEKKQALRLMGIYQERALLFEAIGDFKQAHKYYQQSIIFRDSLQRLQNNSNILELEAKYSNVSKRNQIKSLELNKALEERFKKWLYVWMGVIFLALLIVINLVREKMKNNAVLRDRNKEISDKNGLLAAQNDEINTKNDLIESKNKQITSSINYANRIQKAILSGESQLTHLFTDSMLLFMPRDIVSGDFYWVHSIGGGKIVLAVADCTGHGIPGAFMSMIGTTLLNEIVLEHKIEEPNLMLDRLRKGIIKTLHQQGSENEPGDGMDIAICVYDPQNSMLSFAGAKNGLLHVRNGATVDYKGNIQTISYPIRIDYPFPKEEFKIEKGDQIYMFTDGYKDQIGASGNDRFYHQTLVDLLNENSNLTMTEQREKLVIAFQEWKGDRAQIDDICILGVKF